MALAWLKDGSRRSLLRCRPALRLLEERVQRKDLPGIFLSPLVGHHGHWKQLHRHRDHVLSNLRYESEHWPLLLLTERRQIADSQPEDSGH